MRAGSWLVVGVTLVGLAGWQGHDLRPGWLGADDGVARPGAPSWEAALERLEGAERRFERALQWARAGLPARATLGSAGRWPLYWALRADAQPAHAAALTSAVATVEAARARAPDDGVVDALIGALELERAGALSSADPARREWRRPQGLGVVDLAAFARARAALERAVAAPRFDPGDGAARERALALPADDLEGARRRLLSLVEARRAGGDVVRRLRVAAELGADLARGLAPTAPDEAARLLRALRGVGLRLGAAATSEVRALTAAAIVHQVDEALLEVAPGATTREEMARLAALMSGTSRSVEVDALGIADLELGALPTAAAGVEVRLGHAFDRALLGVFVTALLAVAALALLLGDLGGAIALRADRAGLRLLAPRPWTAVDDLAVALGSFGAAAALGALALRGGAPAGEPAVLVMIRVLVQGCLLTLWGTVALPVLVRGRLLAKHGRTWRRPDRVHLGLSLGLAGMVVAVAPFELALGSVLGLTLGIVGFGVAAAGGALGERDEPLERALLRAGHVPTLRAVGLSLALLGAVDLALIAPWRARVAREFVASRQALLEQDGSGLREGLAKLAATR